MALIYRFEQTGGMQKRRYLEDYQRSLEDLKTLLKKPLKIDYLYRAIEMNLRIDHPAKYNLENELDGLSKSYAICEECKEFLLLREIVYKSETLVDSESKKINAKELQGGRTIRIHSNYRVPVFKAVQNLSEIGREEAIELIEKLLERKHSDEVHTCRIELLSPNKYF